MTYQKFVSTETEVMSRERMKQAADDR